jgi:cytochrome b6-f complex iron-sulfur subunit
METTDLTSRRAVLTGAGVVLGGAVLAACGSGSSDGDGDSDDSDDGSAAGGTDTSSGASATAAAGSSDSSSSGALAKLSDVPVGSAISAKGADGKPIIIAQPAKGTVKAFSAICTHQGCTVAPAGAQLHCPCHGSVFNAETGAVIQGPAPSPLPAVAVKVSGDDVVAG